MYFALQSMKNSNKCVHKKVQMSYPGPFLSVALGELWQHLLLSYFNMVIIKCLHETLVFYQARAQC